LASAEFGGENSKSFLYNKDHPIDLVGRSKEYTLMVKTKKTISPVNLIPLQKLCVFC